MKRRVLKGLMAAGLSLVMLSGCASASGTAVNNETGSTAAEPSESKESSASSESQAETGASSTEANAEIRGGEVTVYTAVDQVFSEKIFEDFEAETGIKVNAVYDLESNKTTGLTNKIISEMEHPVCDVFWNNEFAQTIELQKQGALSPYISPEAEDIPDAYKDKEGYWTAFGGRARTLLVNTDLLEEADYPTSIYDLISDKYDAKDIAIAYPMFGTTRTQAAAIYAALGEEKGREFFQTLKDRGVQIVDGNSVTKDMAAAGQVKIGYTDTDDAKEAIESGAPVTMCFTDQEEGGIGNLITPNTAAIIKGAPDEENAKIFIDYIVSLNMEKKLIEMGFFDLSIRPDADVDGISVKGMSVNLVDVYEMMETSSDDMQEIFADK